MVSNVEKRSSGELLNSASHIEHVNHTNVNREVAYICSQNSATVKFMVSRDVNYDPTRSKKLQMWRKAYIQCKTEVTFTQ